MLQRIFLTALIAVAAATSKHGPSSAQHAQSSPPSEPVHLDQGWAPQEWHRWYTTSQGSRLLPLKWILALEQAGSKEAFLSEANVRKFGYLFYPRNGTGLPLGFAVDTGPSPDKSDEPWAGMTCAACHTADITYGQSRIRVDGAPTQADFQTFMESMRASLQATWEDNRKFERFASAILGASATDADKNKLKADLDTQRIWYTELEKKNASPVRYGHARLDAQGHIMNKISLVVGAQQQRTDFPSDAPASYPFLWNTPQQSVVQWNGIVQQGVPVTTPDGRPHDLAAMIRNITEVVGVFAVADVGPEALYPSSLRFTNVLDLEDQVKTLKAPKWPETMFPPIDAAMRERGEKLYKEQRCNGCHDVFDRDQPPATIKIRMTPLPVIGTDIWLACNSFLHRSKSGVLEGRTDLFSGETIKPDDLTFRLLTNMSLGMYAAAANRRPEVSVQGEVFNLPASEFRMEATAGRSGDLPATLDPVKEQRRRDCLAASQEEEFQDTLAYEPRPLNGIWATAPYLHNGSVPTLFDLLLPAKDRPQTFTVGGMEFDPEKVGFKSGLGDGPFELRVRDANANVILGNDNSGHEYGTSLSDEERKALVEYLKTL